MSEVEWLIRMCEIEGDDFPSVTGGRMFVAKSRFGGMAERTIAPVLKTGGPLCSGGSNPSPSAD